MKNIQVVDGAENCVFPVYQIDDSDFNELFPGLGQDVEFAQDLAARLGGEEEAGRLVMRATARRLDKRRIKGIDGTLFIDLAKRKRYFPNKREDDVYIP